MSIKNNIKYTEGLNSWSSIGALMLLSMASIYAEAVSKKSIVFGRRGINIQSNLVMKITFLAMISPREGSLAV